MAGLDVIQTHLDTREETERDQGLGWKYSR